MASRARVSVKGNLWALPVNEEGYSLFYRKDIFEAEGHRGPDQL